MRAQPSLRPIQAPFFTALNCGDDGTLWFTRFAEDASGKTELLVMDWKKKRDCTVIVPFEGVLRAVDATRVVLTKQDGDGLTEVRVYERPKC